ncbi:MAG: poly(R)-hydroxyalkanoic acid synthase subunit PhaE [Neptuniibacter sp.]|jgi:class III poly(R)-hydroxyalkanoic acid synthase PhaE subunit|uniref:poly(R)-hydroxyalkanoic acid synthase subunit PhaE n=1 Tax=Neptuniibacter sp. TaxID=1962643 RepID=UPI003B5CFD4B
MEKNDLSIDSLLEAQKAYWNKISSAPSEVQSPEEWAEFLSHAHKKLNQEAPQQFSQLLDILGAQSRHFTQYGEDLLRHYRTGEEQQLNDAVQQFQNYMQKQTGEMLMQQWQIPEQFASLFKTHSFSDDLLFENPFISGFKSLLETPVIGGNQETQQQTREAMKLTIEYQEALQEYVAHYGSINQNASQQMLNCISNAEEKVSSLEQLHEIWVDAYESAYSKTVFTDEYQRSHGRISNALMRLRKFAQDVRDVHFQTVGLATRSGLDTALKRQHQLRKEMRSSNRDLQALKKQVELLQAESVTSLIADLKKEITSLKREVTKLKKANQG